MTEADVVVDRNGTRQLGELNRGKLWERTEKHEDFPDVSWNNFIFYQFISYPFGKGRGASAPHPVRRWNLAVQKREPQHKAACYDHWKLPTCGPEPRQSQKGDVLWYSYDVYFMIYHYFSFFRLSATCRSSLCRSPTAKRSAPKISSANCITGRCSTSYAQSGKLRSRGASGRRWRAGIFHFTSRFIEVYSYSIAIHLPRCRRRTLFMPVVFAFVNDNPEGQLAANIFNSAQAKAPCRVCK